MLHTPAQHTEVNSVFNWDHMRCKVVLNHKMTWCAVSLWAEEVRAYELLLRFDQPFVHVWYLMLVCTI